MIDNIPNDLLGNDMFRDFVTNLVESMQMKINNDLKFGELTLDDEVVKATWFSEITNRQAFEMMRTFNLILNGSDADAFANVTKFISDIETIYLDGENRKNEILMEE